MSDSPGSGVHSAARQQRTLSGTLRASLCCGRLSRPRCSVHRELARRSAPWRAERVGGTCTRQRTPPRSHMRSARAPTAHPAAQRTPSRPWRGSLCATSPQLTRLQNAMACLSAPVVLGLRTAALPARSTRRSAAKPLAARAQQTVRVQASAAAAVAGASAAGAVQVAHPAGVSGETLRRWRARAFQHCTRSAPPPPPLTAFRLLSTGSGAATLLTAGESRAAELVSALPVEVRESGTRGPEQRRPPSDTSKAVGCAGASARCSSLVWTWPRGFAARVGRRTA